MKVKTYDDLRAGKFTTFKTYKDDYGHLFQVRELAEVAEDNYLVFMGSDMWRDHYEDECEKELNEGMDEETWWEKKENELWAMDPMKNAIFVHEYLFEWTDGDEFFGQIFLFMFLHFVI